MSERQRIVKQWLKEAKQEKITSAYVANQLGTSLQNFSYHLNESPELDLDLFNKIKKILSSFINTEDIKPTAATLLNKDKQIVEALQSELNEARDLLNKILGRFFFLDHFYDERYSTFYLKSRVTDPVDYETSDVLTEIENFLNLEVLREDAHRAEIVLNKIIMDNENNKSKNDDAN